MATIQDQIRQAAIAQGIDPAIALAVAQQESGFSQAARGTSGEVGVFQLMPGTASGLNVNPYDTGQNIQGGVSYLAQLYRQFGTWAKALVAYNAGPGNAQAGTAPSASYTYAQSVLGLSTAFGSTADVSYDPTATDSSSLASMLPDLTSIPNWVWLAALGGIGLMLFMRRD